MSDEKLLKASDPLQQLLQKFDEMGQDSGQRFCCIHCLSPITTASEETRVYDKDAFEVTNPDGYDFHLVCFNEAWGCKIAGMPAAEYSWFDGFLWQYAVCLNCEEHLGWYYLAGDPQEAEQQHFFALITDKLTPADENPGY